MSKLEISPTVMSGPKTTLSHCQGGRVKSRDKETQNLSIAVKHAFVKAGARLNNRAENSH
jgi:hypothetical protein